MDPTTVTDMPSLLSLYSRSGVNNLFVYFLLSQAVTEAAGQGVSVASKNSFNNWNWQNAVIFAATVITTIGEYI